MVWIVVGVVGKMWEGSYTVNAGMHRHLFHRFLRKCFFGGSASLHDLFLHFLEKSFFCNLFYGVFLGSGNTCVGVSDYVRGGWCWNGMCLRMFQLACQYGFQPVSIRKAIACKCMGEKVLSGSAM